MKKWTIIINAESESTALEFLDIIKDAFECAIEINQPTDHVYVDKNNGETMELMRMR